MLRFAGFSARCRNFKAFILLPRDHLRGNKNAWVPHSLATTKLCKKHMCTCKQAGCGVYLSALLCCCAAPIEVFSSDNSESRTFSNLKLDIVIG